MADFAALASTTGYLAMLAQISDRDIDVAKALDPANTTVTNPPTNAVRYNSANKRWEKHTGGGTWAELITAATDAYAITVTGLRGGNIYGTVTNSGTISGGTINATTLQVSGSNVWTASSLTNLNQLTNGPGYITSSALSPYAPLASPTFTGVPAAPTAAVDTNTTQLATTAFVVGQGYLKSSAAASTYMPLAGGTFTGAPSYAADPGGANVLTRKSYVDTKLSLAGGTMTGALLALGGTNAAPGVAFSGDPNTGIYSSTADTLSIATAGTQRMTFLSDGKVGINTNAPDRLLTVQQAAAGALASFKTDDITATGSASIAVMAGDRTVYLGQRSSASAGGPRGYIYLDNDSEFWIQSDSGTRVVFNETGNYLFGLTSSVFSSTDRRTVEVNGTTSSLFGTVVNGTARAYFYSTATATTLGTSSAGGSHAIAFAPGDSEKARLTSAGRLGIGTNAPSNLLEVRNDTTSSASAPGILIHNRGTTGAASTVQTGYLGFASYRDVSDPSVFAAITVSNYNYPGNIASLAIRAGTNANSDPFTNPAGLIVESNGGSNAIAYVLPDGTPYEIGFRNIPIISTTGGTAGTTARGKCYSTTGGITIPNSTFAAGDVMTIYNNSASSITITASISTLRLAGTNLTGNRTLTPRGMATVLFLSGTEAVISGAGVN